MTTAKHLPHRCPHGAPDYATCTECNREKHKHPAAASGAMREKLAATPYDLVPFQEITEAYIRVAEYGAEKYAPWNWSKGLSRVQLLGSLLRHAFAYLRGQDRDRETGLLHTDHILWNAAALSHNVHWGLADERRGEPARAYKEAGEFPPPPRLDRAHYTMDELKELFAGSDTANKSPHAPDTNGQSRPSSAPSPSPTK